MVMRSPRTSVPNAGRIPISLRPPVSDAEIFKRLNSALELARPAYEEMKIKHNLWPTPQSKATLEKLRKALEACEESAARWPQPAKNSAR
jgi:hypothetical protein